MTLEQKILPKIFLSCEPYGNGDVLAFALAEDGTGLGSHLSSNVDFAKHDIGLTSRWHHEDYHKHYPTGYVVEWIDTENLDSHKGFQKALVKNKENGTGEKA